MPILSGNNFRPFATAKTLRARHLVIAEFWQGHCVLSRYFLKITKSGRADYRSCAHRDSLLCRTASAAMDATGQSKLSLRQDAVGDRIYKPRRETTAKASPATHTNP